MQSGTHGRSATRTDPVESHLPSSESGNARVEHTGPDDSRSRSTAGVFRYDLIARSARKSIKSTDDAPISNALIGVKFSENRSYDSPLLPYQG